MSTEDDTFDRLKRAPASDIYRARDLWWKNDSDQRWWTELLEEFDWTDAQWQIQLENDALHNANLHRGSIQSVIKQNDE